jgi:hypothetical protein
MISHINDGILELYVENFKRDKVRKKFLHFKE